MARHAEDREDLFAEASALTTRIELTFPEEAEIVVAGCRRNGAWSIYFGAEPCYHFDPEGRLRRAFADGRLYRTQGDTLARLDRARADDVVELRRVDLDHDECRAFVDVMRRRLERLLHTLNSGDISVSRRHPDELDVSSLLSSALRGILTSGPQLAPAIPTRSR